MVIPTPTTRIGSAHEWCRTRSPSRKSCCMAVTKQRDHGCLRLATRALMQTPSSTMRARWLSRILARWLSARLLRILSETLRTQSCGFVEGCLLLRSILIGCLLALPRLNFLLGNGFTASFRGSGTPVSHICLFPARGCPRSLEPGNLSAASPLPAYLARVAVTRTIRECELAFSEPLMR